MTQAKVFSINISQSKGTPKTPIASATLIEGVGLQNDAHAAGGIKQVSLLSIESMRRQSSVIVKRCNCLQDSVIARNEVTNQSLVLNPGDFAENITTEGITLVDLKIGTKLKIGDEVIIEISKIGKECHKYCAIYYKTGDCIMPREGIFAKVLKTGIIKVHDKIEVLENRDSVL